MGQKCTPLFKIATRQPHLPVLGQCALLEMIAGVYLSSLAPMDKPLMDRKCALNFTHIRRRKFLRHCLIDNASNANSVF
jgi:hypothetical protein